ncbi:hypothetical protein B0H14DRAFT_2876826 [Mycena olivaceomarginata]|nr:hypothetical protein B0H14DRAFT_2876826 [Mycena olivaceomarginata]
MDFITNLYLCQRITLSMLGYCATIEFMGDWHCLTRVGRIRWPVDRFFDRCLKRMVSKTGGPISSLEPHPPSGLLKHVADINHLACAHERMYLSRHGPPRSSSHSSGAQGYRRPLELPPFMILLARAIDLIAIGASPSDIAAAASKFIEIWQNRVFRERNFNSDIRFPHHGRRINTYIRRQRSVSGDSGGGHRYTPIGSLGSRASKAAHNPRQRRMFRDSARHSPRHWRAHHPRRIRIHPRNSGMGRRHYRPLPAQGRYRRSRKFLSAECAMRRGWPCMDHRTIYGR